MDWLDGRRVLRVEGHGSGAANNGTVWRTVNIAKLVNPLFLTGRSGKVRGNVELCGISDSDCLKASRRGSGF
jgi:hypothetical protein